MFSSQAKPPRKCPKTIISGANAIRAHGNAYDAAARSLHSAKIFRENKSTANSDVSGAEDCPGQDSNLHAVRRYHLKVVRLPIPPPGRGAFGPRIISGHPQVSRGGIARQLRPNNSWFSLPKNAESPRSTGGRYALRCKDQ